MARLSGMRALLPAAALLLGIGAAQAAPAGSTEYTQYLPVWLGPGGDALPFGAPALLNLPPGWTHGDAAAVIAPGGDWPPGTRDRLVAALLEAGTAVLEVNVPRDVPDLGDPVQRDLAEALNTLHEAFGAGLVIVVGQGAGGEAALLARAEAATTGGRRYAGAIRLGPGAAEFRAGAVPAEEAWPARAPLLCEVLTVAWPGDPAGFATNCAAGLVAAR